MTQHGKTAFGERRHQCAKEMYELLYQETRTSVCKRCGNEVEKRHSPASVGKLFGVSKTTVNLMIKDYLDSLHRPQDPERH
jgi:hypothetical protein